MTWPHTRATLLTARSFFALPMYAGMKNKTGTFCPNKQKKKNKNKKPAVGPKRPEHGWFTFFYSVCRDEQWEGEESTTTRLRVSLARYIRASARRTKEAVGPGPITPPTLTVR